MDEMAEISKRIEELEKENRELREKLEKCKELLRAAVHELEEKMSELCETTETDSAYSPCLICVNQQKDGEPRCKIKRSDFGCDWNDGKHPTYIKELEEELKESNDKIKKYKLLLNEFNLEECCEMCKHRDISRFEDTCYECICGKNHFEAKYPDEIKELLADNPRWTRNSAM